MTARTPTTGAGTGGAGTGAGLSATAAWAVALAAVVGTAALSTVEPAVGLTALSGVVLGLAGRLFGGGHAGVTLGAALLPLGFAGVVAGVGRIADLGVVTATLAMAAALVGVGLGGAFLGSVSPIAFRRAGDAGAVVGVATGLTAVVRPVVSGAGGPVAASSSALNPLWSVEGGGLAGPLAGIGLATVAVAGAVRAVPPAAFTVPTRRERAIAVRSGLVRLIVVAGAVAIGSVLVVALLDTFVLWSGWLEPWLVAISTSELLRAVFATTTVGGVIGVAVTLFVRTVWRGSGARDDEANVAVPTLVGVLFGTTVLAVVGPRVDPSSPETDLLAGMLLVTALLAVATGLAARRYARAVDEIGRLAGTAVGLGLGIGAVVIALTADLDGGVEAVATGGPLAAVCALGSGLFAHRAATFGNQLSVDVGRDAVGSDVQLVRVTWIAVVAGGGVLLAGVGLALTTLVSPTLSVPATLGVGGGILATVAAAWLLFR